MHIDLMFGIINLNKIKYYWCRENKIFEKNRSLNSHFLIWNLTPHEFPISHLPSRIFSSLNFLNFHLKFRKYKNTQLILLLKKEKPLPSCEGKDYLLSRPRCHATRLLGVPVRNCHVFRKIEKPVTFSFLDFPYK